MFKKITCVLISFIFFSSAYAAKLIAPVSFQSFYSTCQYSFKFNRRVSYKGFALSNPNRWVLDFANTMSHSNMKFKTSTSCPVKSVRNSQYNKAWRVVFDLRNKVTPRIHRGVVDNNFIVEFAKSKKTRITTRSKTNTVKRTVKSSSYKKTTQSRRAIENPKPTAIAANPPKPRIATSSFNKHKLRPVVILIDPGHGGKDPGTTGKSGIHEKYVVLSISKYLADYLNNTYGFKAYLTRKTDVYLKLRERLAIARKYKPNLFVAIHADAFLNDKAHGASIFALSQRGATSEAARWIAERENASELLGGVNLNDKSHMLRSVLLDLSQTATIGSSMQIGQEILSTLKPKVKLHHNTVEQAAFVVLKSPDIPSLLIETGFLSNRYEESLLRRASYRKKIASIIGQGIVNYFERHPPSNSLILVKRKSTVNYLVKRGDSLSKIADRYNISVGRIKSYNRLASSDLRVGQLIRIPRT